MNTVPHIALLIETSHTYGRDLLRGITQYARIHGPWFFTNVPGTKIPFDLKNTTGMIIRDSVTLENRSVLQKIRRLKIPVIYSQSHSKPSKRTYCIVRNNPAVGRLGAEYFIKKGFQNLAYCGMDYYWSKERQKAFSECAESHWCTLSCFDSPITPQTPSPKTEQKKLIAWLKSLPPQTGLMCCNDHRAKIILELCKEIGIMVPEDISVLGADNDDLLCEISAPPLSSIAFNSERAGYEAAKMLDCLIQGKKPPQTTVVVEPTHVVTRQTTDVFATDDKDILTATRFIHAHANRLIQVEDVVGTTALCRRALEKRFKKVLGHSIHEEILHARMDSIARILIDTNLSVTEIAEVYGYEYPNNLSRPFKRITGYNMVEYRKKFKMK